MLGCHRRTVKAAETADMPAAVQNDAVVAAVAAVDVLVVVAAVAGEDGWVVVCCWEQRSWERSDCDWVTAAAGSEGEVEK